MSALLLSCFCIYVLNQQLAGFFLVLISSFHITHNPIVLPCVCAVLFLQNMHIFFSQKKNTLFWFIVCLIVGYSIVIFVLKPYKIHVSHFIIYSEYLFIFIWSMFIKWDTKKIITMVTALGIYLLLAGFAEWVLMGSERIQGPLSVATCYAVVLVLLWSIWYVENCFSRHFSYFIMIFGSLLVFFAIILSKTRMGIVGIVIGILLGAVFSGLSRFKNNTLSQKIFHSIFILGSSLLLIFVIWTLIPDDIYVKRALNMVLSGKIDSGNMGRVVSWIIALNSIQENKIWGIGPGNFADIYKSTMQNLENVNITKYMNRSHNLYLMILSEYGFSGFLVFILIVIACFKQLFYRLKNNNSVGIYYALLSCGIITMVLGMVDIIPFDWFSFGLVAWYMGILASFSITKEEDIAK
jgi:O-antigen ligase